MFGLVLMELLCRGRGWSLLQPIESSNSGHLEGIGEIEYRTGEVEEDVVFVKVSSDMNGPKANKLFDPPDVMTEAPGNDGASSDRALSL